MTGDRLRVLTVGAYERDNFGDLLFLLVTEKYLQDCEVIAAAPFAADMTPLLDRHVHAFGDVLAGRDVDAIWTVGGQVGGTSVGGALRMSKSPREHSTYAEASPSAQSEILAAALNRAPVVSPYLPTPGAFPRNADAVTAVTSVGLAGAASLPVHIREEVLSTLSTTDAITVRDRQSSEFLSSHDIPHLLAPDVVHALAVVEPGEPDPGSDIAVVQASSAILARVGHARLARQLVDSRRLAPLRFHLLLAGTATGHDSVEDLELLAAEIHKLQPNRPVEILTDRRPLDVVRQIRSARIVIGTSLHVRIVAAAYGLPRVTLRRAKPTRYAEHWDPFMPYDVRIRGLGDAVGAALDLADRPDVRAASERLSELADDAVRGVAERIRAEARARDKGARQALAERRRSEYVEISRRRDACRHETDSLRDELFEARREIESARSELERARAELAQLREAGERTSAPADPRPRALGRIPRPGSRRADRSRE